VYGFKYFIFLVIIFSTLSFAEKTSVAVIDLKNAGGVPDHFSTLLSEALRAEMFKYDKFDVRNREDVKSVLEEQAFQQSGACDDNACYVRMGKVLGVEKIVTGSIGKLENTYSMTIKQIDVETSANDKIISNRKQCTGDDLFIMIENAVKDLVRIENNKLTEPGEFKEIKEIQPQRLTPADGFDVSKSDDVKEWDTLGLSREEYIEYKKINFDFNKIDKYREEKKSVGKNICKSLLVPGWGNLKRSWLYYIIDIGGIVTFVALNNPGIDDYVNVAGIKVDEFALKVSSIVLGTNRIISSIDAAIETNNYNESLKQKYKLSLSPIYNPQNDGFGLGFSVNF